MAKNTVYTVGMFRKIQFYIITPKTAMKLWNTMYTRCTRIFFKNLQGFRGSQSNSLRWGSCHQKIFPSILSRFWEIIWTL